MKHFATVFSLLFSIFFLFSIPQAQDLSGIVICIDPGHDAENENQGPNGLKEHDVNMQVARYLEEYLYAFNVDTVILTRFESSRNVSLSAREDIANDNGVDWFHSIHHNAFNGEARYTLMLYSEIPVQKTPLFPDQADVMCEKMGLNLWQALLTTEYHVRGDWSFYGGENGGWNLGVLNDLFMPGELSEATFHDNSVEEAKLHNQNFLRFEAIALLKSFLEYFQADSLHFAMVSGIVRNSSTNQPIDGANVNLMDSDQQVKTDEWHNGFYAFPQLEPDQYTIEISARGYQDYQDTVTVVANQFNNLDFYLTPYDYTVVNKVTSENNLPAFSPYDAIEIEFSRPMAVQTVEQAVRFEPEFRYQTQWLNENKILRIDPKPILKFGSQYTLTIDSTAKDINQYGIDGDKDKINGDPFIFTFATEPEDQSKPQILASDPVDGDENLFIGDLILLYFNKPLKKQSLNNIFITESSQQFVEANVAFAVTPTEQSLVTISPIQALKQDAQYTVTVSEKVADENDVEFGHIFQMQFTTEKTSHEFYIVDNLNNGVINWTDPRQSNKSVNFNMINIQWNEAFDPVLRDSLFVARLDYSFQTEGLLDIPLRTELDKYVNLQKNSVIGVYVFGDNSKSKIRFYFEDSQDGLEACNWSVIDWYGWKTVSFRVDENDIIGYEGGNGILDGDIRLAGFQIEQGEQNQGTLYFDDFFLAATPVTIVDKKDKTQPEEHLLIQSYPNPFSRKMNHTGITISYKIPSDWNATPVNLSIYNALGQKVRELVSQTQSAGRFEIFWDCLDRNRQNVPAGVYFYRLQAGEQIQTRRLIILN